MKVIHGTWIPDASTEFIQTGSFYLWVEIPIETQAKMNNNIHPGHLSKDEYGRVWRPNIHVSYE